MSYMNHSAGFVPAGGLQELSFEEVEQVAGGVGPLVPIAVAVAAAKACSKSNTCKGAVVATAGALAAIVGYENNRV